MQSNIYVHRKRKTRLLNSNCWIYPGKTRRLQERLALARLCGQSVTDILQNSVLKVKVSELNSLELCCTIDQELLESSLLDIRRPDGIC